MVSIKTAVSSQKLSHPLVISPLFFDRPVLAVARDLLGKILVRQLPPSPAAAGKGSGERGGEGRKLFGMITEVEAYDGPKDTACHAHRGRTERNDPMFGPAGHWYVYLVYGIHWMLNVVTGPIGYPAAVLIRGVVKCPGPGKLTRALYIDRALNGKPATMDTGLWIEDHGIIIPGSQIHRTPRIGVDYAGSWAKRPYRFVIKIENCHSALAEGRP